MRPCWPALGERAGSGSRLARSFGHVAIDYDAARPGYAPEALRRAEDALGLGSDARVVDLGAGTGKLTRRLVDRFTEVMAVEPDDEMRAMLEASTPGAVSHAGTAEAIPLPNTSVDAVFVADAFHWFEAPAALREIGGVLRPTGGLALLWNVWWSDMPDGTFDRLDPPLPAAARELLDAVYFESGRAGARSDDDSLEVFADSPFGALHEDEFVRVLHLDPAEVVALYGTISFVASLPERERTDLANRIRGLLSGTYRLPLTTKLFWTRLR